MNESLRLTGSCDDDDDCNGNINFLPSHVQNHFNRDDMFEKGFIFSPLSHRQIELDSWFGVLENQSAGKLEKVKNNFEKEEGM